MAVAKFDRWYALALVMSIAWMSILALNSDSVGVPRDESFYLTASDFAANWYADLFTDDVDAFSASQINRRDRFGWNWEHPVLMKSAFGLSKRIFHDELGWISTPLLAYRLPTMFLAALGMLLVFALARRVGGVAAGFLAQALYAFLPRMFFHSHLACFDMPVTVAWLGVVFCFIKARGDSRWIVPAGIALGLGFATKLNIFFLPFALLAYALLECGILWRTGDATLKTVIKRYALIGSAFIFVGGLVFWVHYLCFITTQ